MDFGVCSGHRIGQYPARTGYVLFCKYPEIDQDVNIYDSGLIRLAITVC